VELKRWVAKEASDSGQVVEDSNLTDQAIFERLQRDVAFRSVATRLLQRYGYLTPKPNPDSDFAKEKELVLKEWRGALFKLSRRKIQNRFGQRETIEISNAPQAAIHVATKIARNNCRQTAAKGRAHRAGNLHRKQTLKESQSNNHHRALRAFCERTDCHRPRGPWTASLVLIRR